MDGPGRRRVPIGPPQAHTDLWICDADADAHPTFVQRGLATAMLQAQLRWVVAALAIDCVLDVGANTGQFAGELRTAGYSGRIVSFEPVAGPLARLREAAADDPDWWVLPVALGDADGEQRIRVVDGEEELSSLLPSSAFGREWKQQLAEPREQTIGVRRLDGLLDEVTAGLDAPRILLKLDTQGYDVRVVAGVGDRLGEVLALLSEVAVLPIYDGMPLLAEQLAAYAEAGFALSGLHPVSFDRDTLRVIELDALLVRPEAVVRPC